jgi:hypothetical protein
VLEKLGNACAVILWEFVESINHRQVADMWVNPNHKKIMKNYQLKEQVYYLNLMSLIQNEYILVKRIKRKDVYFVNIVKIEEDYQKSMLEVTIENQ